MKSSKIFFAIVLSATITIVGSQPRYTPVCYWDLIYPLPTVEIKYLNDFFTKELIIKKSFRDNQLVPIRIELIKPHMEDGQANDLYLTIESVTVSFAIQETAAVKTATYPGHLVLIPVSWPPDFQLEQGSRIVFIIKYNYHLNDEIVEKGELIEQIRF
jgi:hypothetical protein